MKKIFHLACFAFILLAAACSDEKEVTLEYNKIDGLLSQCNELLSSSSEGEDLGDFVTGSKAIFESKIRKQNLSGIKLIASQLSTTIAKSWRLPDKHSCQAKCYQHVRCSTEQVISTAALLLNFSLIS